MKHCIILLCGLLMACQTAADPAPVTTATAQLKPIREIEGLAGTIPSEGDWTLEAQFEEIAFGDEDAGGRTYLIRWDTKKSIRVCLDGDVRGTQPFALMQTKRLLSAATGLSFRETGTCDVRVVSGSYPKRPDAANYCFVIATWFREIGAIYEAVIYVPEDRALDGDCIVEELSQALGLLADSDYVGNSLFQKYNFARSVTTLTYSDAVQLRTLYDPRLRPGMPKDEAMRIVPQIIAEHLADLNR